MAVMFRRSQKTERGARVPSTYNPTYLVLLASAIQWLETAFEGCVLSKGSRSVRIMSDVWATETFVTVWDHEKDGPRDVVCRVVDHNVYSSDEPWDQWYTTGEIDATDEVKGLYAAWQDEQEEKRTIAEFKANLKQGQEEASEVNKGSRVEVYKGRKVPKGTIGEVFWLGQNRWGWRCGIKDDAGETHWTALSNVRVLEPNWDDSCEDCGGRGWVPKYDGKGGTICCLACTKRAAALEVERQAEQEKIKVELDSGTYIGRSTIIEVTATYRKDAIEGTIGEVFWRGPNRFGPGDRVGFKDDAGETHWANLENVKVFGVEEIAPAPVAMAGSYSVPSPASMGF